MEDLYNLHVGHICTCTHVTLMHLLPVGVQDDVCVMAEERAIIRPGPLSQFILSIAPDVYPCFSVNLFPSRLTLGSFITELH